MLVGIGLFMIYWVCELVVKVWYVLVVGSCVVWGGIIVGGDNFIDVCGLQYEDDCIGGLFGVDFCLISGLLVINIVGCFMYLSWVIDMFMVLVVDGFVVDDFDLLNCLCFYVD